MSDLNAVNEATTSTLPAAIEVGTSFFNGDYSNLGITAVCALFLLLILWAIPKIRKLDIFDDGILNSIGGGLALGYVFLHAMPSLIFNIGALKEEAHSHFLTNEKNLLFVIFMFALLGFFALYSLEKIAHDKSRHGREGGAVIYYTHLGMLTYLSFSIALVMPILAHESMTSLILFTFVMGFHFILEDHAMTHHFPSQFDHIGRYVVMSGVAIGWLIGTFLIPPHYTLGTTFMNAFLAGALMLSTTKTEFTLIEGKSHFPTFIASLAFKIAVVFAMLLLENIG